MADGIHTFDDLPPNAKVNEKALRQLEVWRTGTMRVEPTLKQDLAPFQGRIGFLDFETIMRAVPSGTVSPPMVWSRSNSATTSVRPTGVTPTGMACRGP